MQKRNIMQTSLYIIIPILYIYANIIETLYLKLNKYTIGIQLLIYIVIIELYRLTYTILGRQKITNYPDIPINILYNKFVKMFLIS